MLEQLTEKDVIPMQHPENMTMLRIMLEFDSLQNKNRLNETDAKRKNALQEEIAYRTHKK